VLFCWHLLPIWLPPQALRISRLLPVRLRHTVDSGIAAATSAWLRQANSLLNPTADVPTSISMTQRCWDNPCCKVQADMLLDTAVDHADRARLLAARLPGSGDWIEALPLSSVGNKMDNATVRIAAGLRLRLPPIVRSHMCVCGKTVGSGYSTGRSSWSSSILSLHSFLTPVVVFQPVNRVSR